jgi:zinc-ribbon domain
MFCSKCGSEIPDDSQFCRKCGRSLTAATPSGAGAAAAPAPIQASKPKSRKALWILLPIFLLVVWWAVTSHSPGAQQFQQLVKQQHTQAINQDFTVKSNGYYYFKLDVPAGATSVRLQGNFSAIGGSGNDIEAYILPENDFVNWQNRHEAKTFYNSGKVTVSNVAVNLPSDSGTYYFVFDNRFSLLSEKSVRVRASLTYYQ